MLMLHVVMNQQNLHSLLMSHSFEGNTFLQTCEEVPGITTPPRSPDSKVPTTHASSVPVIAAASNTSTLQRNTSPSAQQEQPQEKPTPASTNGTCKYIYSTSRTVAVSSMA